MTAPKIDLIINADPAEAKQSVVERLTGAGFTVAERDVPQSVVGKGEAARGTYLCYETDAHIVVIGLMDLTVPNENEGMETEFCGYEWIVGKKDDRTYVLDTFVSDWHHAIGKGNAVHCIKSSLAKQGIEDVDATWKAFVDLAQKSRHDLNAKEAA
jgi:hypothetical protein